MPPQDIRQVVKAIEDNTRELKKQGEAITRALRPKPINFTQNITGPEEGGLKTEDIPEEIAQGQIVIHRPEKWSKGYIFRAACADKALVDESVLTVSLNERMINCPSCKNPE